MTERWSEQEVSEYLNRRKGMVLSVSAHVAKISREVKHDYKAEFEQQLSLVGIQVEREFMFAKPRKWRSDWRVKNTNLLIEFEGGLYAKRAAGHSSVSGLHRDIQKYNAAAIAGWIVIRVTPKFIPSGQALKWVEDALRTIGATK